jgi:DNA-binding MarR family transcriptional regulator
MYQSAENAWRPSAGPCHATPQATHLTTARKVQRLLRARRTRGRFFDSKLFADPAWDILLELYAAKLTDRRLSVTAVCGGADVPATTALRWIRTLECFGHIERRNDPMDGRRVFLELSTIAEKQMNEYFRTVSPNPD